ncbi:MAG TPA: hypothetical protein VD997_09810 [Phycisphaerales bacterium]|nr:hypothetical protein [Phycisphaerales bacterium]
MAKNDANSGFQWRQFITYVCSFSIIILIGGLFVAVAVGLRPLEQRAAQTVSLNGVKPEIAWPMNAVTPDGKPSTWLPKSNQEEIEQLVIDALGDTRQEAFSPEPLARVADALKASGWFDGTPSVTRGRGGKVNITGKWRVPGVFVRYKGDDYLVSWDGKRLPPVRKAGLERNFRVVMNPAVAPPAYADGTPDYGTAWPGEDIVASIELIELMQEKAWYHQVAGVDASEYSAKGRLTLVTPEGTRVVWGGRPTKPLVGEVSTPQKLAHLSQIMHDYKRIDAGYPLIYVNAANLQFDISATAIQP